MCTTVLTWHSVKVQHLCYISHSVDYNRGILEGRKSVFALFGHLSSRLAQCETVSGQWNQIRDWRLEYCLCSVLKSRQIGINKRHCSCTGSAEWKASRQTFSMLAVDIRRVHWRALSTATILMSEHWRTNTPKHHLQFLFIFLSEVAGWEFRVGVLLLMFCVALTGAEYELCFTLLLMALVMRVKLHHSFVWAWQQLGQSVQQYNPDQNHI